MDFSDTVACTGVCQCSPDGKLVASAANYRLAVRDVYSLQVVQLFSCVDEISSLEWSFDSKLVLCVCPKRGIVQIWNVEDDNWHCKIDEGAAGVSFARFTPDGRHVLTCSEFQVFHFRFL